MAKPLHCSVATEYLKQERETAFLELFINYVVAGSWRASVEVVARHPWWMIEGVPWLREP